MCDLYSVRTGRTVAGILTSQTHITTSINLTVSIHLSTNKPSYSHLCGYMCTNSHILNDALLNIESTQRAQQGRYS